jgi:predicted anti-sigma-YlaC factor YlaD
VSGDEELRPAGRVAAEHAELALDDAAYLLGGLAPAEQARFERHLLSCSICQDAVTELNGLPRLLGLVSAADLDTPVPELPPMLPGLLNQVAAVRRRRTRWSAAAGFAAACVLALLVGIGVHTWSASRSPHSLAMSAVGPNAGAIHATVTLTGSQSAPRIELDCGYQAAAGSYPNHDEPSYRMVVFNKLGQARDLGSWTPQAGEDVRLWRDSPWPRQNLTRIEISDDRGTPVLELRL